MKGQQQLESSRILASPMEQQRNQREIACTKTPVPQSFAATPCQVVTPSLPSQVVAPFIPTQGVASSNCLLLAHLITLIFILKLEILV